MTWKELAQAIAKMTPKQQHGTVTIYNKENDEYAEPELTVATEAESELYESGEHYLSP